MAKRGDQSQVVYVDGDVPQLPIQIGQLLVDSSEISAGVTNLQQCTSQSPLTYVPISGRYVGDIRNFGADPTGVEDSTSAIQAALDAYSAIWIPDGTYKITSTIVLNSNNVLMFESRAAIITTATHDINLVAAGGKTNISIRGGKFQQTSAGASSDVAAVVFSSCTNCEVIGTEFDGMQWAGVWLQNSSHSLVEDCYFHDWLGTIQDACDVLIQYESHYNVVRGNNMYGGGWHGCMMQGSGGLFPTKNLATGNRIGAHTAYGIITYNVGQANSYNQIFENDIEGITGVNPSGGGGAGIYVQSSGGVEVSDNNIRNCCLSTSAAGLTPAGIGINNINDPFAVTLTGAPTAGATSGTLTASWTRATGTYNVLFVETAGGAIEIRVATMTYGSTSITWVSGLTNNCNADATTAGLAPITVTGNTITDIAPSNTSSVQMAGINVSSSTAGATLVGNTITQNAGSVAGIAATAGIYVNAASNVVISGNRITMSVNITNSVGIFLFANGSDISNFTVTGNVLKGCAYAGIRTDTDAAYATANAQIAGNTHQGGGAGCVSYRLVIANDCTFTGNLGNATTVAALTITSSLRVRVTGGSFVSSGANAVETAGTCTGSYFDKSNYSAGSGGAGIESIQNAATGLIVEQLGAAIPSTNTRAVGDRVEQSVPVVGNPKGWRTTVAGTPGTNVSEGNL